MTSSMVRIPFLLLLSSLLVCGQTFTARLTGRVLDPSAAPVAGATVTATHAETNAAKAVRTDESGIYVFPILLPSVLLRMRC